jgi:hypothetical protein
VLDPYTLLSLPTFLLGRMLMLNRPLQSSGFIVDISHSCLADFRLTSIVNLTLIRAPATLEVVGARRWLAHKLLDLGKAVSASQRTSLGCVCAWEVVFGYGYLFHALHGIMV